MTKYLYDTFPYDTVFEAKVISCTEVASGYEIELDQTLFFPEQGGQTPDRGFLSAGAEKLEVTDVQIRDGIIYHMVADAIAIGSHVRGCIDWDYRFNNMQQHTGEHIFSGIVKELFGYENVGFHLSDSIVTMDYSGVLTGKDVSNVEARANKAIWENHPVLATFPSAEELERIDYRSKKELSGQVRIVTIEGVDVCACCAPHVRSTAEVGILKVMSAQNYKGGTRLSILCGERAFLAFAKEQQLLAQLKHILSANEDDLPQFVENLKNENATLHYELNGLYTEQLTQQLQVFDVSEMAMIFTPKALDTKAVRDAINHRLEQSEQLAAVFYQTSEENYPFIIGCGTMDCREIGKALQEHFGAKCGGQARMIQGKISGEPEEIKPLLNKFQNGD